MAGACGGPFYQKAHLEGGAKIRWRPETSTQKARSRRRKRPVFSLPGQRAQRKGVAIGAEGMAGCSVYSVPQLRSVQSSSFVVQSASYASIQHHTMGVLPSTQPVATLGSSFNLPHDSSLQSPTSVPRRRKDKDRHLYLSGSTFKLQLRIRRCPGHVPFYRYMSCILLYFVRSRALYSKFLGMVTSANATQPVKPISNQACEAQIKLLVEPAVATCGCADGSTLRYSSVQYGLRFSRS